MSERPPHSLRRYLLAWIVAPIALFVLVDTVSLYRSALRSINIAYDRSLLASARSIGELLQLRDGRLQADVPYAALEIFEASTASRMYYRIDGFDGEFLSGYADLPAYAGRIPQKTAYPALVDFYDAEFRGERVRMAALYQPVAAPGVRGVARVQVAETMEVRERLAREILSDTLMRQALLIAVVVLVTWLVVSRALRPVESLRRELLARTPGDLQPLAGHGLPRELQPMVLALNELMRRARRLVDHQRRFVRDASHQLRTPLAVLKTQVQNAARSPQQAPGSLRAMEQTVDRAISLANQMLALAKVEQVQGEGDLELLDLAQAVRDVALDLAPLIADKDLDFELDAQPACVRAHRWMLRELVRNLLHNAIRETPPRGALTVQVRAQSQSVRLVIRDSGPGIAPAVREHLFEPFHTTHPNTGSGLGLAICMEICRSLGAELHLLDRMEQGRVAGVEAQVVFPAPTPHDATD
ncbi:MAG TPA: sensor histidine kinase N-terminal domain-containing protein [Burkholderiaceae bacterium]|nr:sensor histidine kinase N-terminal domain-containing protein [Burkholderiaceae bacterium]